MRKTLSSRTPEDTRIIRLGPPEKKPRRKYGYPQNKRNVTRPDKWWESCDGFGADTHKIWAMVAREGLSEWVIIRFKTGLLGLKMDRAQRSSYCFPPGSVVPIPKELMGKLSIRPQEM